MSENKFLSAAASENLARIQAIQEKIARTYHSPFLDTVFRTLEQPEIAHIINSPAYKQMTKNIERINKAFNPYSTPLLQSVLLDLREQCENIPSLPPQISNMIEEQQEILEEMRRLNINIEKLTFSLEVEKKADLFFKAAVKVISPSTEVPASSTDNNTAVREKTTLFNFPNLLSISALILSFLMFLSQGATDRQNRQFQEKLLTSFQELKEERSETNQKLDQLLEHFKQSRQNDQFFQEEVLVPLLQQNLELQKQEIEILKETKQSNSTNEQSNSQK